MASEKTKADAIRVYHTGAASLGAAQTDEALSLGGYRASTEVAVLAVEATGLPANITIDYVSGQCWSGGEFWAALDFPSASTARFTVNSEYGTYGATVTIASGETMILLDGYNEDAYIRITRTSTADLTGTASLYFTDIANNVIGMDDVDGLEAIAGDAAYRCVALKNESASSISTSRVWVVPYMTAETSDTTQLGASGAGTLEATTGYMHFWPDSGGVLIRTSAGAVQEICYYSDRTETVLTIPAAGRALLGTSATAGAATDTFEPIPLLQIGVEDDTGGLATEAADENTAPSGITFANAFSDTDSVSMGSIAAGDTYYIHIKRVCAAGSVAAPEVLGRLRIAFDSVT